MADDSAPTPWPWTGDAPMRFDRFMARALHDPERGYYARRIRGIGRDGDFTTVPMVSDALARAIAGEVRRCGVRHVIEAGPGEGRLAAAVRQALPRFVRWRMRFHLVETSLPLREKQRKLLGGRVSWHQDMESALSACGGRAVVYANELLDAFPVRRFRKSDDGGWRELHLAPGGKEAWEPVSPPGSSVFAFPHPTGQIVEVNEQALEWLGWMQGWTRGRMILIDYGGPAGTLYHRRPRGTLRGYHLHERLEGPTLYETPGRIDLTADVNFTDLLAACRPLTRNAHLLTQRDFLLPHLDGSAGDMAAADPDGAGSAFHVLIADAP